MSPQEFWSLVDERTPPPEEEKVGTMPRSVFDQLVEDLHA